jgi:signal transduction histidine kinase
VQGADPADTLFALLKSERERLVSCWGQSIRSAIVSAALPKAELLDRVPAFVDEIIAALYPDAIPLPTTSDNALEHGAQRLRLGFDVGEIVREYGLLHQCILQLAEEANLVISLHEQQVVARWLNTGIAEAVAQYVRQRDEEVMRHNSEHLGFIAHELRNPLGTARLALNRLRQTEPGVGGRTLDILDRHLRRASDMIDNTLGQASLRMGVQPRTLRLAVRTLLGEIELDSRIEAEARQLAMVVDASEDLSADADPRLLRSAVANLVQNALKFSQRNATVTLSAREAEGRLLIEVSDGCGGLPAGKADELFAPTVQRGNDRSGFGFGLAIALQAAEAHNGTIRVRDVPGHGCVFTIDLPATVPAR